MNSTIEARRELVTPEIAARILSTSNVGNRAISRTVVKSYAKEMTAGEWRETHQGPAFDTDGNLVDGQHRLAAIVESGVPVWMIVTYNIQRSAFDVLDIGFKRQAAHIMPGINKATQAAACRWLTSPPELAYQSKLLNREALSIAALHPSLEGAATLAVRCYQSTRIPTGPHAALLVMAAEQGATGEMIEGWIEGVALGESLSATDPRLVLRNRWMTQSRHLNSGGARPQCAFLLARAWNAYAAGEQLTKLQLPSDTAALGRRPLSIQAVA